MSAFKALIRRHPLLTYFILTFASSWGGILLVIGGLGAIPTPSEQAMKLLSVAIMVVIGILMLVGFVITTLDTAVRLCRYMIDEFWAFSLGPRAPKLMRHPVFNTDIAVGLMDSENDGFAALGVMEDVQTNHGARHQRSDVPPNEWTKITVFRKASTEGPADAVELWVGDTLAGTFDDYLGNVAITHLGRWGQAMSVTGPGEFYFDDFQFGLIPELATVTILGVCGVVALLRRRK